MKVFEAEGSTTQRIGGTINNRTDKSEEDTCPDSFSPMDHRPAPS